MVSTTTSISVLLTKGRSYRPVARELGLDKSKVARILGVLVVSAAVYSVIGVSVLSLVFLLNRLLCNVAPSCPG